MNKLQQILLPIKLEANEERLTSLAGLMVVEELALARGLWRRVEELFPKPGSGHGYRASAYVKSVVWMLQGGTAAGRRAGVEGGARGLATLLSPSWVF